ncbi:facilitated trehalose transporter Tret1-like [Plodia interpunctella]|uniref:facilitated trehalose transporter Tret1-like n=1 Tax=Plodia interpunctella TaxID=58824 RepID=UPI002368EF4C|nr:facilitated trehalose transporter Tret1-like [Plodia interpunctella]
MSICMQICGATIVCFLSLTMGIVFTWPSSSLMLLRSKETVLDRPMTDAEAALLGSISSISALISCPMVGFFLDRVGRKYCAIISSSTSLITWIMIAFTTKVEMVLAAIFISGLSCAAFLIVPIFVSEFCQDSIRGAMTSGSMVFSGIGMLVSYLLGGLLDYYTMAYVCLVLSFSSVLLLFWLRESPLYLMKVGRENDAVKSVAFYRSAKPNSKEVLQEMDNIRRALSFGPDTGTTEEEETLKTIKKQDISAWEFFKRSSSTRRAFYITLILMTASIFQGIVVVQVYAGPLFEQVIPEMSTTLASVLFAVICVVAGFIAAYLTDLIGRRPLIIYSSFAAGVCCILCGTQIQFNWGPNWVTPVVIYSFTMFYTFGAGTVPFVLIAEIFLPEVKSYINMFSVEWLCLCNFLILVIFDPLTNLIGLGCVFYLFSSICVITGIFSFFFVPETKGLPVDEIQILFSPKKKIDEFSMS